MFVWFENYGAIFRDIYFWNSIYVIFKFVIVIVNYFLSFLNIPPVNWLGSEKVAFWTVIMADIWHQISFMILVLVAGLVSLQSAPYEAAAIDGATALQRFFKPLLDNYRALFVGYGFGRFFFNSLAVATGCCLTALP